MAYPTHVSSLGCELRIIRAENIELKSNDSLFVRCYLPAGNNTRVKLNTHDISSNSELFWNQTFSLECFGNKNTINDIFSRSFVVFELRRRVRAPIFGKISKSILLGRAEVLWRSVCETKEMEIEKWVFMSVKGGGRSKDMKPPVVQVTMKLVGLQGVEESVPKRRWRQRRAAECGGECRCGSCGDWDVFALAQAFEGF